jgi:diadenylate cyclase
MRDRRSGKLAVGIILLIVLKLVSELFDMYVIQFLLQNIFQVGLIAIAVIFQPELRTALEKVGGQPLKGLRRVGDSNAAPTEKMIENVSDAVFDLSQSKTGALIVFERLTRLGDLILTGTVIDADANELLIKNVFFNKAPLHDGALIIRDNRLYAAGCLLPLSSDMDIVKELGTRHRAAIGMSENSDAVVVVVSEETGIVSIAVEGVLYRGYNKASLAEALRHYLVSENASVQSKFSFGKRGHKNNKKLDTKEKVTGGDANE